MKPKKQCNYCHSTFEQFVAYHGGSSNRPRNMALLETVGSNIDEFACPACGAHDRERHLKLYCDKLELSRHFADARILHFAPEKHFLTYVGMQKPELHIRADLFSKDTRILPLNVEAIPYDDRSFDVVIANHILEHVSDVDKALSEINRVLKVGGMAILQTPFSRKLIHTFEDAGIDTDALRLEFYGQEDHVRLFGQDIFTRFGTFLNHQALTHAEVFAGSDTSQFGINPDEPLFLFKKRAAEAEASPSGKLPTQTEIMQRWNGTTPVVSIFCTTYNHENFIAQTLESFLMQETNFAFEIVVGEDCSTDKTRDIIVSYQQRYPELIRLIAFDQNVGRKKNTHTTFAQCRGRYVAKCEGDDYWTDPKKLQKQVDYLEAHPECVLTYGAVQAFNADGIAYEYIGGTLEDASPQKLQQSVAINTLTTCFRKVVDTLPPEHYVAGYGDLFIWSILGGYGSGHYIDAILPSRYRIHAGGVHSQQSEVKQYMMLVETAFALHLYYRRTGDESLSQFFYANARNVAARVYNGLPEEDVTRLFEGSIQNIIDRCEGAYDLDRDLLNAMYDVTSGIQPGAVPAPAGVPEGTAAKKVIAYIADPLDRDNFLDLTLNVLSPVANLKDFRIEPLLQSRNGRYWIKTELLREVHAVVIYDRAAYFAYLIPHFKACGIPVLFFITTDVWHTDVKFAHKENYDLLQEHYLACMKEADVIVTANQNLSADIRLDTVVLTPFVDPAPWKYPLQKRPRKVDKFIIAVYVDLFNLNDISMIAKFMKTIQKKYKDTLQFEVHAFNVKAAEVQALNFAEVLLVPVDNYIQYVNYIRAIDADVALIPLIDNRHNQTVSPLPYFIQAMCGIPGIYSRAGLFREVIRHGETGLLCGENEAEWETAIARLISDPELRRRIAETARNQVLDNFTVDHGLRNVYELFKGLERKAPTVPTIPAELAEPMTRYQFDARLRYGAWCRAKTLEHVDAVEWAKLSEAWTDHPGFHFFVQADGETLGELADTVESFVAQLYPDWNLYIVSAGATPSALFDAHEKLHWIQTEGSVYDAVNHVASQMNNAMIGFLEVGDRLSPHALAAYCNTYNTREVGLIYADHDVLDGTKQRMYPQFKPEFNLDMLRSMDYMGRAFVMTAPAIVELGGIDTQLTDSELYDLVLRYLDRFGEKTIGHYSDVLHTFARQKKVLNLRLLSSKIALKQHLQRNGIAGEVVDGPEQSFRVLYAHDHRPLVSIIIPTRNQVQFLTPCIETLLGKTAYPNFEIVVVDNGSDDAEAVAYLDSLRARDRITVVDYDQPFNYSTANNIGASHAKGEYLLLLNNDTEVLHENWLDVLLSYAQRSEVGIVGPRLIFPKRTIQHAGVIVGLHTAADHPFIGADLDDPGYMSRLQIDHNLSAVTAAAMLIKREAFDAVSGLNDTDYKVNFSDVDLCLKIAEAGYKIVFTPHATLLHHGSVTQKNVDPDKARQKQEVLTADKDAFIARWHEVILQDPAYNVNLDTGSMFMDIRTKALAHWNPRLQSPVTRIVGMARGFDGGGLYRVLSPLAGLRSAGIAHAACEYKNYTPAYIMQMRPDIIVYQTPLHDNMLAFLEYVKKSYPEVVLIFEIDDLLTNIPIDNLAFHNQYKDTKKRIQRALKFCDRMVVSTQPLKETFAEYIDDIRVIPNYLQRSVWGELTTRRNRSEKLRVGWAGSIFHKGDLAIIKQLLTTYRDRVEWVFLGMAPEGFENEVEFHKGVALDLYPQKLATLDLDLALVPLEQNAFNEAKSNLRLLEFGILGWPVICSDVYPYQEAPVTRVKNRYKDWEKAFLEKIEQPELLAEEGDRLKAWVETHYILEDHVDSVYRQYAAPKEAL